MEEIWRDIEGYEGHYQVSNLGRVKSLERYMNGRNGGKSLLKERILKPIKNNRGYLNVNLSKNRKRKNANIHRLVAKAFIPNPDNKPEVNHVDTNKKNNRADNLEWATTKENIRHAWEKGLCKPTIPPSPVDKDLNLVAIIVTSYKQGVVTQKEVADRFGISVGTVCNYIKRYGA